MSPPVGPTGLPQTCDGEYKREWRVGASLAAFDTTIVFSGAGHAALQQVGVAASLDRTFGRFTVQAALGAALTGHVVFRGRDDRIRPGPLASIAASYRILDDGPKSPFLVATASLAQSFLSTEASSMRATDARIGVVAGKTFGPFAPFAAARAFGGPVRYSGDTGGDRYHYQFAAGALFFVKGFDASFEVAFLGERRFTLGLGASF